jgi:hypothetical protein
MREILFPDLALYQHLKIASRWVNDLALSPSSFLDFWKPCPYIYCRYLLQEGTQRWIACVRLYSLPPLHLQNLNSSIDGLAPSPQSTLLYINFREFKSTAHHRHRFCVENPVSKTHKIEAPRVCLYPPLSHPYLKSVLNNWMAALLPSISFSVAEPQKRCKYPRTQD